MRTLPVWRLNLLRTGYLLLAVGIGVGMWPQWLARAPELEMMQGATLTLVCAIGLLSAVGLRYPLEMLPLLLFELAWKTMWLVRIALPLALAHRMNADFASTAFACGMAMLLLPVIPWDYVAGVLRRPGARWRSAREPLRTTAA